MKTYPKVSLALISVLLSANLAFADEATNQPSAQSSTNQSTTPPPQSIKSNTDKVYDLGRIEVVGDSRPDSNPTVSTVTAEDIANTSSKDVAEALRYTPGVFVSEGARQRGDSGVSIRGYGGSRIGLFVDGIPIYSIYERNTNFKHLNTFEISEISVSKGYTSPVYGMNTMGGAINIITSKPKDRLEIRGKYEFVSNNENRAAVSIGTNLGKYYAQLSYSFVDRDSLNLSNNFQTTIWQPNKTALNSYYTNNTLKAKLGWQPNENHEYSLNVVYERGKHGGTIGANGNSPYWDWPHYDKVTAYLLGNSKLTDKLSLNSRVYYDSFYNRIDFRGQYQGNGVIAPGQGFANQPGVSIYDDYALGGIFTLDYAFDEFKNLKAGLNLRNDNHNAQDPNTLTYDTKILKDLSTSVFAEYAQTLQNNLRFVLSASYDRNDSFLIKVPTSRTDTTLVKDSNSHLQGWTLQGILYAQVSDSVMLHMNVGKKSMLPTLNTRYGSQWGQKVANPNLQPESAINYESGITIDTDSTKLSVAVFYNIINNMVASKTMPNGSCSAGTGCSQNININNGVSYGFEASFAQALFDDALTLNANYTFTQKNALGGTSDYAVDGSRILSYPNHVANASIVYKPIKQLDFIALVTYQSKQWFAASTGSGSNRVYTHYFQNNDIFLIDLKANYHVIKDLTLSLGAYNLLDRNYYYGTYYYQPGRRILAGIEYKF
ncbi:hypothetical protein CQA49_06190 [Helicobacter sp. MIT 00-7814]|uniref:TonB-dependent receptor n=1 Tax=unclassified Helicobacter TaxID=2593540 RepID=UPI000E1F0B28|nr:MULTISPECIES: TonB-dependent receptor [unclassified Helicobacter]RDU53649.1 hypothetical protein CQA49_06190 [Helicobacter sp. MIT 00-7814]RDU54021.1 hypothetical protein CQA37_06155 [Helicobacter sp. MIT 99-10781]